MISIHLGFTYHTIAGRIDGRMLKMRGMAEAAIHGLVFGHGHDFDDG